MKKILYTLGLLFVFSICLNFSFSQVMAAESVKEAEIQKEEVEEEELIDSEEEGLGLTAEEEISPSEEEEEPEEEEVKKAAEKEVKKEKPKSVIPYTEEEFKMLACVVYLEAGNQPFKGKVAVANAIINRVNGKDFPNTIKKVIHHKLYTRSGKAIYQFTLAKPGGKLQEAMKVYGKRKVEWQKKYEKECIKAAKAALYGEKTIPDDLCFWVMVRSGSWFMKNKPGGKILKDHYFYKWR